MSSTGEKLHNSWPGQILSVHVECTRLFFLALVCRGRLICLPISSRILARIEAMKTPETNTIKATYLSVMTWVCGIHELRSKGNLHGGRRRRFYWEECPRKYHEPVHYINAQFCPSLSRDPDFVFVCLSAPLGSHLSFSNERTSWGCFKSHCVPTRESLSFCSRVTYSRATRVLPARRACARHVDTRNCLLWLRALL